MKPFTFLIVLLTPLSLFAQDISTFRQEAILLQYQKIKEDGILIKGEDFIVSFSHGFNDTVIAYINGKQVFKEYCLTNEALSSTLKGFKIEKQSMQEKPLLTIVLPYRKVYIEIVLDNRFKKLSINRAETWKQWPVIFTNFVSVLE